MKRILIFPIVFFLIGCSSPEAEAVIVTVPEKQNVVEDHEYKLGEVMVKWTAFKHAAKAQVGGKFNSDSIKVSGFNPSTNLSEAINGLSFAIPTSTTSTGDKTRDYKIITSFFNTMSNTKDITGTIIDLKDNGSGLLSLNMNDQSIEKDFSWELDENSYEIYIKTSINILDWGAEAALNALNEVCLEQHTGPDGVNKLWPDVDITVIAAL